MKEKEVRSKEDEASTPKRGVNRRQFMTSAAVGAGALAATTMLEACGGSSSSSPAGAPLAISEQNVTSTAWKFGVMADTQWVNPDDLNDPDTSAIGIINQIQQQFIASGVKFVVHVGDLADNPGDIYGTSTPTANLGEDARAVYAQALYNAGIGFFPLRGNHDDNYAGLNSEFLALYPQTQSGVHNGPISITAGGSLAAWAASDQQVSADNSNQPVPTQTGAKFTVGSNFSSPTAYNGALTGLTYSFDCNNARFILIDQFTPIGLSNGTGGWDASYGSGSPTTLNNQQSWISTQLAGASAASHHAFVFSHKGLLTLNHTDMLTSTSSGGPADNPTYTDAFIGSLVSNGARYLFCGHDHMYDRSLVSNSKGTAAVTQIVTASDSGKYYIPHGNPNNMPYGQGVTNDTHFNKAAFGINCQTPIQQEISTVGFYIVTVDGANVSVDYYSAPVNVPITLSGAPTGGSEAIAANPTLNFVKQETFGYGLNGQQFLIAEGSSYTKVQDSSPWGTSAKVLGGTNNSLLCDATNVTNNVPSGRQFTKAVNTGWDPKAANTASDILMLQGMTASLGNYQTDAFALSMSVKGVTLSSGYVIATVNSSGAWTNAVNENFTSGAKVLVNGPWKAGYAVGTYGVDTASNSVWAVLNYNGPFAIAQGV
jgi:hypothetical protein